MRDIIIKNVKDPGFERKNLNQFYDPDGEHKREYEFSKNEVFSPYRSGEGQLTVNFYTLMPGKSNYPYHQHFGKEEAFYIISGEAVLKTPGGDVRVKEGDVIVIPPNENRTHADQYLGCSGGIPGYRHIFRFGCDCLSRFRQCAVPGRKAAEVFQTGFGSELS